MKNLKQQLCCLLTCAAAVMLATAQSAAAAGVIFDNGAPNHVSGNNLGFALQAEDFSLAAGTTLSNLSFWSLEASGAYRGSISWSILNDAAGAPGASTIASGTQSVVSRTGLGLFDGLTEYRNDFSFNAPLALGAGNYWLVLHNGSVSERGDPNEFYWETAAANASVRGFESLDPGAAWTTTFNEHAFQISAVPEPEVALMLLAGVALLAGVKRREQASDNFA